MGQLPSMSVLEFLPCCLLTRRHREYKRTSSEEGRVDHVNLNANLEAR